MADLLYVDDPAFGRKWAALSAVCFTDRNVAVNQRDYQQRRWRELFPECFEVDKQCMPEKPRLLVERFGGSEKIVRRTLLPLKVYYYVQGKQRCRIGFFASNATWYEGKVPALMASRVRMGDYLRYQPPMETLSMPVTGRVRRVTEREIVVDQLSPEQIDELELTANRAVIMLTDDDFHPRSQVIIGDDPLCR